MKLDDFNNPEELRAALARGDKQLEADIAAEVKRRAEAAVEDWDRHLYDNEDWIWDPKDELAMLLDKPDFEPLDLLDTMRYVSQEDAERFISVLGGDNAANAIVDALRYWGGGARSGGRSHSELFYFTTDDDVGSYGMRVRPVSVEYRLRIDDEDDPLSWVPDEYIEKALEGFNDSWNKTITWEPIGGGEWASGWVPTSQHIVLATVDSDATYEWLQDQIRDHYSSLADLDEEGAAKELDKFLERHDKELLKQIRKLKLPLDVKASLAVSLFADEGEGEGLRNLYEIVGNFGYEGSRGETILEIDRPMLRSLGITSGRWWDGAPWKLVNLPPAELAYEGALQRHCVGRHDMGYRQAVENGYAQIWSLRSKFNKPVLTWDVNIRSLRDFDGPGDWSGQKRCNRGRSVSQLKGSKNRKSGQTREEAMVLGAIFEKLDIDPNCVEDFRGVELFPELFERGSDEGEAPAARMANPTTFDEPWRPYEQRGKGRGRPGRGKRGRAAASPNPKVSSARKKDAKPKDPMADLKRRLMRG